MQPRIFTDISDHDYAKKVRNIVLKYFREAKLSKGVEVNILIEELFFGEKLLMDFHVAKGGHYFTCLGFSVESTDDLPAEICKIIKLIEAEIEKKILLNHRKYCNTLF